MYKCLICESEYEPFMSFGQMPIANGFLTPVQFAQEYFYELKVGFCEKCSMVQLSELVDRDKMFHENYAFFSSTSKFMAIHFKEFADLVQSKYLQSDKPFVVEIGSNDGIMLQHFAQKGISHLGIEPSANVADVAKEKGIQTICKFFDADLAENIKSEFGQADAILGANVMCHIPYLHSVVEGIKLLLKPKGVLIFEDPYLVDILEKTSYDQIYDEHAFYFSVSSISYLFSQYGLEVIDTMPQNVHGGSMRYTIAHKGAYPISANVIKQKKKEHEIGVQLSNTYINLRKNIELSRDALLELLQNIKSQNKRIVGYGATSKSTTVTNYCGITSELVEFISDTTPIKHGKYSPGAHIPVKPYEEFIANYPEYALLFAWNHAKEIISKEKEYLDANGKFIVYVPKVQVLT